MKPGHHRLLEDPMIKRRHAWLVYCLLWLLGALLLLPAASALVSRYLRAEAWYEGRSVGSWRKDLNHDDPAIRREAAKSLGCLGEEAKEAVPALAAALKDDDPLVRVNVAFALFKIGPEARAAVPALAEALADTEVLVRMDVALALCRIGPDARAAVPALTDAMNAGENRRRAPGFVNSVRREAARALGNIGPASESAVPDLCEALGDDDPGVCFAAVRALGKIGPGARNAVPPLRQFLGDKRMYEGSNLGTEAAEALRQIEPAAVAKVAL
jgi:HEAT repeat protein